MGTYADSMLPSQTTCKHCGTRYKHIISAHVCCLFAPKKHNGWCAWCGENAKKTFCNKHCAIDYNEDVFSQYKKNVNNKKISIRQ